MNNRNIMLEALNKSVIKDLKAQGFSGRFPHFKRVKEDCIELICFQTNKYGGSFVVEVSAVFPDSKVTNLSDSDADVDINKVDVSCTNERYRLKGMFDGWFYYSDVYKMPQGFYHNVLESEKETFKPSEEWTLLQSFDELAADEICEEISLQLDDAFDWLYKLERNNRKHFRPKSENEPEEKKVINKRIFEFLFGIIIFLPLGIVTLAFDKGLGILFLVVAVIALVNLLMTPTSYVFSEERVVIKYFFGLQESINWKKLLSVRAGIRMMTRLYISHKYYDLNYIEDKKRKFFMQGEIERNKKTAALMEKYCPKKID